MVNWKEVDRLARAHRLIDPGSSEQALFNQLRLWWCLTYNRPFKDPLIETYTLDELAYEYLCHFYLDPKNDPLKEKEQEQSKQDDDAWVQEQMKKVQAATAKKAEAQSKEAPPVLPDISTKFDG
jgi:hypothetical protein